MATPELKPHQEQLLRELVARGRPIPADEVDGRSLRPLRSLKLVVVRNGLVMPTGAALVHLRVRPGEPLTDEPDTQQLSASQQDLLWSLGRRSGPALADHLDGRSLRPLLERGLVTDRGGWISISDEGRALLETMRKARRKPSGGARTPGGARAETIWRALDLLEDAVPSDAEVPVGGAVAYGDDVLLALRELARELKRER